MMSTSDLRDTCQLLGGLALDGARVDLLREIQRDGTAARLGTSLGDELGVALSAMQHALDEEELESLAVEFTRLLIASGARKPVPVPPWEDCYVGKGRVVQGDRSRAALLAYATARFAFDGITEQPADHMGLELCFVAALLDEERSGERDGTARAAFVEEHLKTFSPAFGRTLSEAAGKSFWREAGKAIAMLPAALSGPVSPTEVSPSDT